MVEPIEEEWDLVRDGLLWKDVLCGFADNPEFKKQFETFVAQLQNTADRSDPMQLILYDRMAANYLRQKMVREYESAHRQIARHAGEKTNMPPHTLDSATANASFPRPEVLDNILRCDQVLDRQFHKDSIVLEKRQSVRDNGVEQPASRKPSQSVIQFRESK